MLHIVEIKNHAFLPPALTIKMGDTVQWRNSDGVKHSARHDSPPAFNTGLLSRGEESGIVTFNEAIESEITYYCEPHPHMRGKIIMTTCDR